MIRQLRITALLTTALLMTGCGIMKTSSEMAAADYKLTTTDSKCTGTMVSSSNCTIANKIPKFIYFDFGTSDLDMNDRKLLDNVVESMGKFKRIEVTGYTCKIGPDQINQDLSESRALAIKTYLMQKGIEESRIAAWGKGKRKPIASNSKEETRLKNRRVEMQIFR